MPNLNKALIIGHLGGDPEVKDAAGSTVANFSVATTEKWKDKSGAKQERTEWHRVVLWGRLAEIARDYLHKGDPVYVEGRIQTRKWQGQDGQDRYTTEIVGSGLQLLGGRKGAESTQRPAQPPAPNDEDIPF